MDYSHYHSEFAQSWIEPEQAEAYDYDSGSKQIKAERKTIAPRNSESDTGQRGEGFHAESGADQADCAHADEVPRRKPVSH